MPRYEVTLNENIALRAIDPDPFLVLVCPEHEHFLTDEWGCDVASFTLEDLQVALADVHEPIDFLCQECGKLLVPAPVLEDLFQHESGLWVELTAAASCRGDHHAAAPCESHIEAAEARAYRKARA